MIVENQFIQGKTQFIKELEETLWSLLWFQKVKEQKTKTCKKWNLNKKNKKEKLHLIHQ